MVETGLPGRPKSQRASGFYPHLPELELSQAGQAVPDKIRVTHRGAATGNDQVRLGGGLHEGSVQRLALITNNVHLHQLDADSAQHPVEHIAVAVIDCAFIERVTEGAQFVARREKGDARATTNGDTLYAQRGQETYVRRAKTPSGVEDPLSLGNVFAGAADMPARLMSLIDGDHVVFTRYLLLHDDGVATARNDAASHDAHALPRCHMTVKGRAGHGGADERQLSSAAGGEIGAANGVTVHG
jgi:hypothetical protein